MNTRTRIRSAAKPVAAALAALALASAGTVLGQTQLTPTPTPAPTTIPTPEVQNARSVAIGAAARHLLAYRTKDARAAVDTVKDVAATNAVVATLLGRVLEQEKKYPESVTQLKLAASLEPSDPEPQVWLGETYLRQKKSTEATAAFKKAAELAQKLLVKDVTDVKALYYLGVAQQRSRTFDKAVATLTKARELDPTNPLPQYQLGVTRAFQQRWTDAVAELTAAIEQDSGIAFAYYYRALAQDKLGKKDQLVLDMERFLALAPNAPEAANATAIVSAAKR